MHTKPLITHNQAASQRKIILERLKAGESLTALQLTLDHHICSPRKRISELRKSGYPIKDALMQSQRSRFKVYFLASE